MLSRVEGLLIGLGGAFGILPGLSGVGVAVSVANVCGVERRYGLIMALLMNLGLQVGFIAHDVIAVVNTGLFGYSFGLILNSLLAGAAAFGGTYLGIRLMTSIAENKDYSVFGYYCWGVALFAFILNLMA